MRTAPPGQRPARSALGLLLDRDGPEGLGSILAELAEAAVVDTRVLLAHRLGTDETAWPAAEDRFASDLLLHERIADPWLRTLTRAAFEAPIPVLFGGHTLVGPGLRRLLGRAELVDRTTQCSACDARPISSPGPTPATSRRSSRPSARRSGPAAP